MRRRSSWTSYRHPVARQTWIDLGVGLVLTAASQAEIWSAQLRHTPAAATSTAVVTAALVVRRRWPARVGALALAVLAVQQLVIGDVEHASAFAVVAMVIVNYSLGAYADFRRAVAIGLGGIAAFAVVVMIKDRPIGDVAFVSVVLFAPWLAGIELHRRSTRVERLEAQADALGSRAEERARAAVEDERARIARELHDVVAHAMSVIVVQAGAERHVLPAEQESTRMVLETIERTGRQALGEMRRLVGMMRSDDPEVALAPQPSLAHLPDLCEQVRAAGLPVALDVVGGPVPVPPGVDVSAYRIVQEALTNVLKHAGPASARVRVVYGASELEIEISDDGWGVRKASQGAGHGLVGMHERVSIYGGELEAGGGERGGFAIKARLPLAGSLM